MLPLGSTFPDLGVKDVAVYFGWSVSHPGVVWGAVDSLVAVTDPSVSIFCALLFEIIFPNNR